MHKSRFTMFSREIKLISIVLQVFDDIAVEITMAILQFLNSQPSEEYLFRMLKALSKFVFVSCYLLKLKFFVYKSFHPTGFTRHPAVHPDDRTKSKRFPRQERSVRSVNRHHRQEDPLVNCCIYPPPHFLYSHQESSF